MRVHVLTQKLATTKKLDAEGTLNLKINMLDLNVAGSIMPFFMTKRTHQTHPHPPPLWIKPMSHLLFHFRINKRIVLIKALLERKGLVDFFTMNSEIGFRLKCDRADGTKII